jgi:hypothetical protein
MEIPVDWWDAEADKSLLIGVFKHGVYFRNVFLFWISFPRKMIEAVFTKLHMFLQTPQSYYTFLLGNRALPT